MWFESIFIYIWQIKLLICGGRIWPSGHRQFAKPVSYGTFCLSHTRQQQSDCNRRVGVNVCNGKMQRTPPIFTRCVDAASACATIRSRTEKESRKSEVSRQSLLFLASEWSSLLTLLVWFGLESGALSFPIGVCSAKPGESDCLVRRRCPRTPPLSILRHYNLQVLTNST